MLITGLAERAPSYQPIVIDQPFAATTAPDVAAKPGIEREPQTLLEERYDLGDHPAQGVTMEHGKTPQEGVRVKLPLGVTWEQRGAMSPDEIREWGLWPKGGSSPYRIPTYRRPGVSKGGYRRDKAAGRARPDPQREGFVRTVPDRHHSTGCMTSVC